MRNEAWRTIAFAVVAIVSLWRTEPRAFAQQTSQTSASPAPQTQGAVSSGGAHAAVLDNEKRPITAGGFVDNGPVVFQEVAEKAGLTRWRHVMGSEDPRFIL